MIDPKQLGGGQQEQKKYYWHNIVMSTEDRSTVVNFGIITTCHFFTSIHKLYNRIFSHFPIIFRGEGYPKNLNHLRLVKVKTASNSRKKCLFQLK